jgi:hypothetical protein
VLECQEVLGQLDLALQQQQQQPEHSPSESAVADFKTAIDVATHELSVAFEALKSTGKIELRLDTSTAYTSQQIPQPPSTASTADRKLSESSSAQSLQNPEIASLTSAASSNADLERASEEKEVWVMRQPRPMASISGLSPHRHTFGPNQHATSFFQDPLSVPIEEASMAILAEDDVYEPSRATIPDPRDGHSLAAGDTISGAAQHQVHVEKAPEGSRKLHANPNSPTTSRKTYGIPSEVQIPESPKADEARDDSHAPVPTINIQDTSDSDGTFETAVNDIPSSEANREDAADDGPAVVVDPTAIVAVQNPSETPGSSNLDEEAEDEAFQEQQEKFQGMYHNVNVQTATQPDENLEIPPVPIASPEATAISSESSNPAGDFKEASKEDPKLPPLPPRPPKPPSRAPPPPPPPPKIRLKRPASRYRVVNARIDEASDDELYSSSRPTSTVTGTDGGASEPVVPHSTIEVRPPIPEVRIDQSPFVEETASTLQRAASSAAAVGERSLTNKSLSPIELKPIPPWKGGKQPVPESSQAAPSPSVFNHGTAKLEKRKPPPVVPRRSRIARSASIATQTIPISVQSEHAPESSGLQVNGLLEVIPQPVVTYRKSVDEILNIGPSPVEGPEVVRSHSRPRSHSALNPSRHDRNQSGAERQSLNGFYAPDDPVPEPDDVDLDSERANQIVRTINDCRWNEAQSYLEAQLEALIEKKDLPATRRIEHLLGVCHSFNGQLPLAIFYFISAMRKPIDDISDLDMGDCAAGYWLGDAYAMLNRRTEALLAYSIAERGRLFQDPLQPRLHRLIAAEQRACQLGVSKADLRAQWLDHAADSPLGDSILHPDVISLSAAMALLDQQSQSAQSGTFKLDGSFTRAHALGSLHHPSPIANSDTYYRMKITAGMLKPRGYWPLEYDPFFSMVNVARGRLLTHECDLLEVFQNSNEPKIPRSGTLGIGREETFTCNDLSWLVQAVRQCLEDLGMEWSEVANVEGVWFVVRHSFKSKQKGIATTDYFSIALFKQSLRSGYGVELVPDGMCSARLTNLNIYYEKGVHHSEPGRLRKLIREHLDQTAKQRSKCVKSSSIAHMTRLGSRSRSPSASAAQQASLEAPPIPPRPTLISR